MGWIQANGFGYSQSHIGEGEGGGDSGSSGGGRNDDDPYWEKAEELAAMGLPPKLCWQALKMFGLTKGDGGGIQRATNFLWSEDVRFLFVIYITIIYLLVHIIVYMC